MTDTTPGKKPRRAFYRGGGAPIGPSLAPHSIFMKEQQIETSRRLADKEGLTIASFVRLAVERYLDQPYRLTPPPRLDPTHATRTTFRCDAALWQKIRFRAEQEETTASGVVAAALALADNNGVPPHVPGRISRL